MRLVEALNIPKDIDDQEGGHRKKYRMIVEALGYEEVKKCIPFSIEEIRKAYKKDGALNSLPLRQWDMAAGFYAKNNSCALVGSRLTDLYWRKLRVNVFSCCDGVCVLKECARMWAEEEE